MNSILPRRAPWAASLALAGLFLAGCTVGPGGVYNTTGVIGAPDYFEPYGPDYGGWDNNFQVGPYGYDPGDIGGMPDHRAYAFHRPEPGRRMPSIPNRGRGGDHRSAGRGGNTRFR